jgi:hypothetical protein
VDNTFIFYNGIATSSGAALEIRQETTDEVVDIPITHFPCSIFWKAANPYIDENPGPQRPLISFLSNMYPYVCRYPT